MLVKQSLLVASLVYLTGCQRMMQPEAEPIQKDARSTYALLSSPDGTFMVDSTAGKVWKYDAKENAFLQVPVTSKLLKYERGPDGKGKLVPDNDPLGIR